MAAMTRMEARPVARILPLVSVMVDAFRSSISKRIARVLGSGSDKDGIAAETPIRSSSRRKDIGPLSDRRRTHNIERFGKIGFWCRMGPRLIAAAFTGVRADDSHV